MLPKTSNPLDGRGFESVIVLDLRRRVLKYGNGAASFNCAHEATEVRENTLENDFRAAF